MSIIYSADVQCDNCGNWTEGATGKHLLVTNARKVAKNRGWSYSPKGEYRDLCPECLKLYQRGELNG